MARPLLLVGRVIIRIFQNEASSEFELADGETTVGGGPTDDVRIEGLKPAALLLFLDGPRLLFDSREPIAVDGGRNVPDVPQLWVAGQSLRLGRGVRLERAESAARPRPATTRSVLMHMLSGHTAGDVFIGPSLLCVAGKDRGQRYVVGPDTQLGRGVDAQLQLSDGCVSRAHARVERRDDGSFWLHALQAHNPLKVDARRLLRPKRLEHGQLITLGRTVLRWEHPEDPARPPVATSGSTLVWAALVASSGAMLALGLLSFGA